MRSSFLLVLSLALVVTLSACGRKGSPIMPAEHDMDRIYPPIDFPKDSEAPPEDATEVGPQRLPGNDRPRFDDLRRSGAP